MRCVYVINCIFKYANIEFIVVTLHLLSLNHFVKFDNVFKFR